MASMEDHTKGRQVFVAVLQRVEAIEEFLRANPKIVSIESFQGNEEAALLQGLNPQEIVRYIQEAIRNNDRFSPPTDAERQAAWNRLRLKIGLLED